MNKNFSERLIFLILISILMIITNVIGFNKGIFESIPGMLILSGIALTGFTISQLMEKFIKLPSMMYVSLLGLILASPISPISSFIISSTSNVAFLAPATTLGAFAGLAMSNDVKTFAKSGWKIIIVTFFVIISTFFFSAVVADIVLRISGAI